MNTNFIFVRHGYSCTNAIGNLVSNKMLTVNQGRNFLGKDKNDEIKPLYDPELTSMGVDVSINNGEIITKIIKDISYNFNNIKLKMNEINVVGCSPLIRSMETAFFMTRSWKNPPNKIYVFPCLREIDESSSDKYSKQSLYRINTLPGYAMKTLEDQKLYLKSVGLLDYFDFSFVENEALRMQPGDISKFIIWFNKNYVSQIESRKNLNVFIVTHAGVLKDYSQEGFYNNSGFVLNGTLTLKGFKLLKYISLNNLLPTNFFKDYDKPRFNKKSYYCPSNRCGSGQLCLSLKDI